MKPKYPDGILEANLANCLKRTICEGGCTQHVGPLRVVRVIDRQGVPYDWGYYTYCEEAVAEDLRRGMTVILENKDGFMYNTQSQTSAPNT